jgi:hypothetical protein
LDKLRPVTAPLHLKLDFNCQDLYLCDYRDFGVNCQYYGRRDSGFYSKPGRYSILWLSGFSANPHRVDGADQGIGMGMFTYNSMG